MLREGGEKLRILNEDHQGATPEEVRVACWRSKANPSKPSADAMLTLLDKLRIIEATGVLGVDLLWLNGNYQRALFHHVRQSSVIRLRELAEPRRRAELVCFLESAKKSGVGRSE